MPFIMWLGKPQEDGPLAEYGQLMLKCEQRLDCVDHLLTPARPLTSWAIRESVFLQFRLICETLAIASLMAHNDLDGAQSLHRTYAADELMNRLASLHPDYFPLAVTKVTRQGKSYTKPIELDEAVTRDELVALYRQAGSILHVGSLKRVRKGGFDITPFTHMRQMSARLRRLITTHWIIHHQAPTGLICQIHDLLPGRVSVMPWTGAVARKADDGAADHS